MKRPMINWSKVPVEKMRFCVRLSDGSKHIVDYAFWDKFINSNSRFLFLEDNKSLINQSYIVSIIADKQETKIALLQGLIKIVDGVEILTSTSEEKWTPVLKSIGAYLEESYEALP